MKKQSNVSQDWVSISDAAKYLGVSKDTLRRWEKKEKISSKRTVGSHRRYSLSQLQSFFTNAHISPRKPPTKKSVVQTPQTQSSPIQYPTSVIQPPKTTVTPMYYPSTTSQQIKKRSFRGILITLSLVILIAILILSSVFLYYQIRNQKAPSKPLSPIALDHSIQINDVLIYITI